MSQKENQTAAEASCVMQYFRYYCQQAHPSRYNYPEILSNCQICNFMHKYCNYCINSANSVVFVQLQTKTFCKTFYGRSGFCRASFFFALKDTQGATLC